MAKKTKILITHAFGPQNRGDHELLVQLIEILQQKWQETLDISVFTTYPDESKREFPGISFQKSPFFRPKNLAQLLGLIWDGFFWLLSCFVPVLSFLLTPSRRSSFTKMRKVDYIFMCPGGYMYSNGSSFYVNLVNGLPFRCSPAKKIAAPMSIGPFYSNCDYFLAKNFLKMLDRIHVRESFSLAIVKGMGLSADYTHDLAWWENNTEVDDLTWKDHFVGTVIDWNYPETGPDDIEYLRERYICEYVKAAEELYQHNGKPLILYNQVGMGDGTSPDEILIETIVSRSKGTIIFDGEAYTPTILKARMKYCRGVMASRFHSALFAIQMNVPFVALSYQPKAKYILKDLGLSNMCRNIDTFDGVEVAKHLILCDKKKDEVVGNLLEIKCQTRKNIKERFIDKLGE